MWPSAIRCAWRLCGLRLWHRRTYRSGFCTCQCARLQTCMGRTRGVSCFWKTSNSKRRCRAAVRNQRPRIPTPKEGRTVAAPYEDGAVTSLRFFRFWYAFLNNMLPSFPFFVVRNYSRPMETSVSAFKSAPHLVRAQRGANSWKNDKKKCFQCISVWNQSFRQRTQLTGGKVSILFLLERRPTIWWHRLPHFSTRTRTWKSW